MKLHFITFEVNYPKYLKQKISVTSMKLHLRSKVQGQLSKVSKAKNFSDLYFHENTLQAAQKNCTVNTIQLKYDVSCKKLHFFTCEVQGQLSKEKQKISVTSMKLHFIKLLFIMSFYSYKQQNGISVECQPPGTRCTGMGLAPDSSTRDPLADRETRLKTLPSRNLVGGY